MKKLAFLLAVVTAPFTVPASIIPVWNSDQVVVVAAPEPRTVSVSMVVPADFVSVPLRIYSDQKNSALAYDETRQAIETISQKVKENGRFRTSTGVVSLSRKQGGFGISGGSWSEPAASAEIYLLVPLTEERADIFLAGAEAARFIETLRLPGRTHCELGRLQLAVENPEQYRSKLLGAIAEEIKKTRSTMAVQGSVKVDGLASSLMVRQADDRHVELFLGYSLSITIDK
jgi:hypothetical protein